MIKRTLKDVRPELVRVSGTCGLDVSDSRFLVRLNKVVEELMNEGDWPGVVDRYRFAVYGGYITLPADLNRVMQVAVDGIPVEMRSPWYEFVNYGPGPQDSYSWLDVALDRGEVCTLQQVPEDTPCTLEVESIIDERVAGVRPKLIVRGYDEDGVWIRSAISGSQADGLEIEINGDTPPKLVESSVDFTAVESVIKPVTKGYVSLYANDGSTRYHLGTYAPNETIPSYRRYFIPFATEEDLHTILVRARKRFIPIRDDNDILLISNVPALEAMIKAIQKREEDDYAAYGTLKAIAVDLLNKEANSYRGKARKPALTFSAGVGIGSMSHVR